MFHFNNKKFHGKIWNTFYNIQQFPWTKNSKMQSLLKNMQPFHSHYNLP